MKTYKKLWDTDITVLKREMYTINGYMRKGERS